jgi:hypothetical protein
VHHQVLMRVADRSADLQQQLDARAQRQLAGVRRQGHAVDVLHRRIRQAVVLAAVEQVGDARMLETAEDAALLGEAPKSVGQV